MKRILLFIILLLIILFCLNASPIYGQENPEIKFTHESYSKELNDHIYPIVKNHIKRYKHAITKYEAQQAIDEVHEKIMKHFSKDKFPIVGPPLLSIVKMETKTHCAYVFHIIVIFYDMVESTPEFELTTEYSKRFVVYVYNKNTVHAEIQSNGSCIYTNTEILRCNYEIKKKDIR